MLLIVFRAASVAAMLFLLVIFTPLAWLIGEPLRIPSDARPADAIVLFSSGQIEGRWLSMDAAQRLLGALDLWRRGFAPLIVPSGSERAPGHFEAQLEASWLARAGVPPEALAVEAESHRTYESVVAIRDMMQARGWRSVVIVSSDLDILRIRMVCDRLGVQASYLGVPQESSPDTRGPLYLQHGFPVLYHAAYEYAAIALYWTKGWI